MRFVVIFSHLDNEKASEPKVQSDHFSYLQRNSDRILLAGGLKEDASLPFCGALWIVEAEDRAQVAVLAHEDPYSLAQFWSEPSIFAWGKAPHYGPVVL